jgi:DNA-binding CsgD family transcriptional regulator
MEENSDNYCLYLGAKGTKDSAEREIADKLYKVVSYFAKLRGVITIHCDRVAAPGKINDRLMKHIIEDKLVIADLSGNPPHVFYGLALRHSTGKPAIHIIEPRQKIPFDFKTTDPLEFNLRNDKAYIDFRRGLEIQIDAAIKYPQHTISPATTAIHLIALKKLGIPQAVELANFLYNNADLMQDYKIAKTMLEAVAMISNGKDNTEKPTNSNGDKNGSILGKTLIQINIEKRALRDKLKKYMQSQIFPIVIKMDLARDNEREFLRNVLISKINWLYAPLNYIDLSPQEIHICELVADGLSAREISRKLNLSYYLILGKQQRIIEKLELPSRGISLKKYLRSIS